MDISLFCLNFLNFLHINIMDKIEKLNLIKNILGDSSSQIFRESYFNNNHKKLLDDIVNYTKHLELKKFPQKVWHYVYEVPDYFYCKGCGINKTSFHKNWLNGYRQFCCAKCSNNSISTKNKIVETCKLLY